MQTSGNIRSVNVDYFGEPQRKPSTSREAPDVEVDGLELRVLSAVRQLAESGRVELDRLVAFMADRWPRDAHLLTGASVERASRSLARSGHIQMGQREPGSRWFVAALAGEEQTNSASNGRTSVSSAKSKSTTLDSGLGGANEDEAEPPRPSAGLAIVDRVPQSGSSILSRLRASRSACRRPDATEAEQVVAGRDDSDGQKRRSGLTLTRSFSFRQLQSGTNSSGNQHQHQHPDQHQRTRPKQSEETKQREATNEQNEVCSAGKLQGGAGQNSTLNQQQQSTSCARQQPAASKQNANLSSLFRSKSLRAVSSWSAAASKTRHRAPANHDCDIDDERDAPDDADDQATGRPRRSRVARARSLSKRAPPKQQATIDYLTESSGSRNFGSRYRRTFSMRRNSLLAMGRDELGGGAGRIAMFLRRLFSIGRPTQADTQKAAADSAGQQQLGIHPHHRLVDIHHHHHHQHQDAGRWPENGSPAVCSACRLAPQVGAAAAAQARQCRADRHETPGGGGGQRRHGASPLSSPSQNSLIEILNCSGSLDQSKRDLRQEEAAQLFDASRHATCSWKLLAKRSESSLSLESQESSNTNKSTVSQQLLRHLDEANKRHRNCTSKRERDFIDSINVLRQASRHASLENSRSSSKNRRHHPKQKCSSASQTSGDSSQGRRRRSINSSDPGDESGSSSRMDSLATTAATESISARSPEANEHKLPMFDDLDGEELFDQSTDRDLSKGQPIDRDNFAAAIQRRHWPQRTTTTAAPQYDELPGAIGCEQCCWPLVSAALAAANQQVDASGHPQPICNQFACLTDPALSACCLAMPPMQTNFVPPPPLLPAATNHQRLDHNHHHHNIDDSNHNQQQLNQLALPSNAAEAALKSRQSNELCCPIWRSMIYSYCQQQQQHSTLLPFAGMLNQPPNMPIDPSSPYLNSALFNQEPAQPMPSSCQQSHQNSLQQRQHQQQQQQHQPQQQQQQQLDRSTFSSTQLSTNQQQQQRHNTTIDLKIEIGADFKKLAARSSRRERPLKPRSISAQLTRHLDGGAQTERPCSSTDDSLEDRRHDSSDEPSTSATATDDSLQLEGGSQADWPQTNSPTTATISQELETGNDSTATSCEDDHDQPLPLGHRLSERLVVTGGQLA